MIAFVVAGTASGVGKTTVALALMAEFRERGWVVQPFKCGPDFLDPGHLSAVCGRTARNLDTWMMDSESVRAIFEASASDADVAIVEGMMGLFDGAAGGEDQGSTAAIAKLLNLPIVLVLDAAKGARSIAAVVKGFESFDPALHFAGVVLNGVSSQAHYQMLEVAIREVTATPLLGRIPKDPSITIPERYLGLHTAEEQSSGARRAQLAEIAGRHLDLSPLLELPGSPVTPPSRKHPMVAGPGLPTKPGIRIGVARDRAFSFYYEDNFDLLRQNGAEIVFFSPLTDVHLPANLDALYLGGGYPELHADALSRNVQLGAEIGSFVDSGKPLYAECGGFIYLGSSLTMLDGTVVPMSGVLPVDFEMTTQLVQFGYVEVEFVANCLLGAAGTRLRGHSFHCSRFRSPANLPTAYRVHYSLGGQTEAEGFTYKNVLATYIHLPFRGNPGVTACLVEAARRMQAVEVRA